jgi:hypothetical protein
VPSLNWIGKEAVVGHHRQVPYHLLRCDNALSCGAPTAGSLLVERTTLPPSGNSIENGSDSG